MKEIILSGLTGSIVAYMFYGWLGVLGLILLIGSGYYIYKQIRK